MLLKVRFPYRVNCGKGEDWGRKVFCWSYIALTVLDLKKPFSPNYAPYPHISLFNVINFLLPCPSFSLYEILLQKKLCGVTLLFELYLLNFPLYKHKMCTCILHTEKLLYYYGREKIRDKLAKKNLKRDVKIRL
jgi:hypothetical protein